MGRFTNSITTSSKILNFGKCNKQQSYISFETRRTVKADAILDTTPSKKTSSHISNLNPEFNNVTRAIKNPDILYFNGVLFKIVATSEHLQNCSLEMLIVHGFLCKTQLFKISMFHNYNLAKLMKNDKYETLYVF